MQKLKKIRIDRKLTQQELADMVGIYRKDISNYENGKHEMRVDLAKRIGKVLEIDWRLLYED